MNLSMLSAVNWPSRLVGMSYPAGECLLPAHRTTLARHDRRLVIHRPWLCVEFAAILSRLDGFRSRRLQRTDYWRIYVRTRYQDGSQGSPLSVHPWDLDARHSGDTQAMNRAENWRKFRKATG
jgi:hypothetical protein